MHAPDRRRFTTAYWLVAIVSLGGWLAFSRWLVPHLIADVYRRESLSVLNRIISGREVHSLDYYLESWDRLAGTLSIGLIAAVVCLYAALRLGAVRAMKRGLAIAKGRAQELLTIRPAAGLGTLVSLGVGIGLVAGLAEFFYLLFKNAFLKQTILTTTNVDLVAAWMAPLAVAILFAALAILLRVVAIRWSTAGSAAGASFLFVGLGAYGVLRSGDHIHTAAAIIFSLGIGAVVARRLSGKPSILRVWAPRVTLALAGLTLVLALAGVAREGWNEDRTLAALPDAEADAPNVLLITLDTVRARSLSLYGYDRPTTPRLTRWAASGVVFERAIAPSPWTLPTHASLFTGRYAHETSADWATPLDDAHPVLAEVLGRRGYATAAFVANLYYGAREFGLDRGFGRYEVMPMSLAGVLASSWLTREIRDWVRRRAGVHQDPVRKTAADVNQSFLGWLDERDERPFFAFLNYYDAHAPYLPPEPYNVRFANEQPRYWLNANRRYAPDQLAELQTAYDGALAYLDAQVGELLDRLEARGELERTVVVITSDHGEEFGSHGGVVGHGGSLYIPALRVPLIILYPPHVPGGRRVQEAVSLRDLPATILDLIGFEGETRLPGTSLTDCWADAEGNCRSSTVLLSEVSEAPWQRPSWAPASKGPMKSLVLDGMHYIREADGVEKLYDLRADPDETVDLSGSRAGARILPRLRSLLAELDAGEGHPAKGE